MRSQNIKPFATVPNKKS